MLKDLILREFEKTLLNKKNDKLIIDLKDEIEIIRNTGEKNNDKIKR